MYCLTDFLKVVAGLLLTGSVYASDSVPTEIQMPGTQPGEIANFESSEKCANCHAGYNDADSVGLPEHEPVTGWRGGAMGNAGRDAIFWATVAVSEQDFDGAGDLCIRCHSTGGWYGERSTPTDGSGLASTDDEGVDCDTCHALANPDDSEHLGVMNSPFTANCSDDLIFPAGTCNSTSEGYYGSGMLSIWGGGEKLGPYAETVARHDFAQSKFQRDVDYCGSCHDVSNPAVGDLAPNHGAQLTAPAVVSSDGDLGGPVEDKAAFNNPPYAYGIVERTFSEYKASAYPTTRVGNFNDLPADIRTPGGSVDVTYQAAMMAASEAQEHGGIAGDYADGTPRFFSCQSCHMRPVESAGADKNDAEVREDLPAHDHTGGNYWFADITRYQDDKGVLRLGGGLSDNQLEALEMGQQRAVAHLQQAASLQVSGNTLKVTNLTGHKLISGYPEGRRMWINIKWYDDNDTLLREDGAYGAIDATVSNPSGGPDVNVESILDLDGTNTRIYEAHYAVTRPWATTIAALHGADFVLNYDRISGDVECTVGDFLLDDGDPDKKDLCKGDFVDTFHFVLNNYVSMDNRIPPYGMQYDIARKRNTLPSPANQYGGGTSGSTYNYWDEITLNPPLNAHHARIDLLYQGTSWEYIQFLNLANNRQNAFLGQEGVNMLDAWLNAVTEMDPLKRTMVAPIVMASVDWEAYSVGGNVSGLAGSGLVLQNNGGDDLAIHTNGSFTFTTKLGDDSAYLVTVETQPTSPSQSCVVTNGSGVVFEADVINVDVTCTMAITCKLNTVSNSTEHSQATHEACETLVVGPDFIAADGSNLSVNSGREINFLTGFKVEHGATLNANVCGQSLCMTSILPMPYGCHTCIDQICAIDPNCCTKEFNQTCLDKVNSECGLVCE